MERDMKRYAWTPLIKSANSITLKEKKLKTHMERIKDTKYRISTLTFKLWLW